MAVSVIASKAQYTGDPRDNDPVFDTMKPKDPVWNFFKLAEGSSSASVRCIVCSADVSAKVARFKAHRQKCPALHAATKKRPLDMSDLASNVSSVDSNEPHTPILIYY